MSAAPFTGSVVYCDNMTDAGPCIARFISVASSQAFARCHASAQGWTTAEDGRDYCPDCSVAYRQARGVLAPVGVSLQEDTPPMSGLMVCRIPANFMAGDILNGRVLTSYDIAVGTITQPVAEYERAVAGSEVTTSQANGKFATAETAVDKVPDSHHSGEVTTSQGETP